MKQLIICVLFLAAFCICPAQKVINQQPVLNKLEDFFQFENVEQLTSYFGTKNVFTESVYYSDPNEGGKSNLVSEVNFGTPRAVLLIWNSEGTKMLEVRTNIYFYDFDSKKTELIPNKWKTKQGIFAGMHLSQLVAINWWPLSFNVQHETGDSIHGDLLINSGWIRKEIKVPFSIPRLIYNYTLDLRQLNVFFPQLSTSTLKSNNKMVRKWNPLLEMVTIYREDLRPENK
ncbi:MAG: hypothetical protein Q8904_11635 [Bacteroidota bacterium]|nr:hypothetical protein [Bacteroidota bacterium]